MKKLLAIAPYSYLPYYSGGQKFIALFLEYLGKETDLTVISVAENDFSLAKNYRSLPWLKKNFSRYLDSSLSSRIIELIKKENFDYIIWEHPYFAWAAYRVKQKTGIKTILHTHNIEHQRFRSIGKWWWPVLKKYEKWFFGFSDYIFFITKEEKEFAINEWNIAPQKCIDVPFGVEVKEYPGDRKYCKEILRSRHGIKESEKIFLFNGALYYKPNSEALQFILEKINPALLNASLPYKIIICGKGLPLEFDGLKAYKEKNIVYAGFVEDIDTYFKGADLFLNPVETGGGIKTKMVEAIGFGASVLSTKNGARGINKEVCGEKLAVTESWNEFAKIILQNKITASETPAGYYEYYYWENIIRNLLSILPDHSSRKAVND